MMADPNDVPTVVATGRFLLDHAKPIVNALYVLCEEQCRERGMSDSEFGAMMADATFSSAHQALLEELENFIQQPERRAMFRKMLTLAGGVQAAVLSETNRILDEKLVAMDAQIAKIVKEKIEPIWAKLERELTKAGEVSSTITSLNVLR